jgi:hypothetical protein
MSGVAAVTAIRSIAHLQLCRMSVSSIFDGRCAQVGETRIDARPEYAQRGGEDFAQSLVCS